MIKYYLTTISLCFIVQLSFAQTWQVGTPLPVDERHHPITFSIDGIGYMVTGSTPSNQATNDFLRYLPDTETWEIMDDFPGPGRGFSYGVEYNGKGYIGFGVSSNELLADFWEYDPVTDEWTELASCPCDARIHPAFLEVNGKIYVGLGGGSFDKDDWWEYDVATDTWTERATFIGPPRHHPYFFSIDGIAYVGFGHRSADIYNTFYAYDPSTDEWTQLNDLPGEGRVAGTQFSYDGYGYILSGQGEDHVNFEFGEFWKYDPSTDSWEILDSHPGSGRWAPGSFLIDNKVHFLAGRANSGDRKDMFTFELEMAVNTKDIEFAKADISPNPTHNFAQLTIPTTLESYTIYDTNGRVVQSEVTKSTVINLSSLMSGIYQLQAIDVDGKIYQATISHVRY